MSITADAARAAAKPALPADLGELRDVKIEGDIVIVDVTLRDAGGVKKSELGERLRTALEAAGARSVELRWADPVSVRRRPDGDPLPQVANIILVMSGKGGVGKSTVATNLALALHRAGSRVGILDADIYGPSIPTMLGVNGRPFSTDGKKIEPLQRFGVKLMSIGFLLEDPKSAVIWRGPMLTGALMQFVGDVSWGELDYLVLDLPPGTGDIALTLAQRLKVTGAVIVTTPQEVALQDVYKAAAMCKKVEIPVLGVVENMSYFEDPAGLRHELFGAGGGQAVADFAEAPLLGQLVLDPRAREWGDKGTPIVQAMPHLPVSKQFVQIADRLIDRIEEHNASLTPAADFEIDRSGGTGRVRLPMAK